MKIKLGKELRYYQKEAVAAWEKNGCKGIIDMATGAGKTLIALEIIRKEYKDGGKIIVIVPTEPLLNQWKTEISRNLKIRDIGVFYGKEMRSEGKRIVVAIINSARKHPMWLNRWRDALLVVDECHRAGSRQNRKIFDVPFPRRLGLSATPRREWDDEGTKALEDGLGQIVYKYSLKKAIQDGVLAEYDYNVRSVCLTRDEMNDYQRCSDGVRHWALRLRRKYQHLRHADIKTLIMLCTSDNELKHDKDFEKLNASIHRRARIIDDAQLKIPIVADIVDRETEANRIFIFAMYTKFADIIADTLKSRNHKVAVYHSRVDEGLKESGLRSFKRGKRRIMVSCRSLEEGIDIPEADCAIFASSSSVTRQFIQRRGRVLRKPSGEKVSRIYDLFVVPVDDIDRIEKMKDDARVTILEDVSKELKRIREIRDAARKSTVDKITEKIISFAIASEAAKHSGKISFEKGVSAMREWRLKEAMQCFDKMQRLENKNPLEKKKLEKKIMKLKREVYKKQEQANEVWIIRSRGKYNKKLREHPAIVAYTKGINQLKVRNFTKSIEYFDYALRLREINPKGTKELKKKISKAKHEAQMRLIGVFVKT